MTLKNHLTGLSERAKAFSVENLLNEKDDDRSTGKRELTLKSNRKINPMKISNDITTELCASDLWRKFSEIGTEMIVTKAGRRMFPTLKVRFHGLSMSTTYIVYMDVVPVGETRYRYIYHSSQWMAAGTSDVHTGNNLYIHPDSPATGQLWISQGHISFDKIKLTNNKRPIMTGQISLQSMHKYQPRIHILEVPISDNLRLNTASDIAEYVHANQERSSTFIFKETSFITVTAYQNQEITKLKIQSNPFAKGFRETSKSREGRTSKSPNLIRGSHASESSSVKNTEETWPSFHVASWCEKHQRVPLRLVIPPVEMRAAEKPVKRENYDNFFYRNCR